MAKQATGQVIDLWSRDALGQPPAALARLEQELRNPLNRALRFAESEGFFEMCEVIAWGDEDRRALGEMLRGLVTNFLPKTRFHLQLLHNIAALQWQIHRVVGLQHNVFSGNTHVAGRHRLPQGTHDAMTYGREFSRLSRDLQLAVQTYRLAYQSGQPTDLA